MAQPIPSWSAVIDREGKLHLEAPKLFVRYLATLKNQSVSLVVRKRARPKSRSQLGFIYGALYPVIAESLGYCHYEIDALHDAIMRELRGLKPDPNPLKLRVSLSEMSHEEVGAYIDDLRHWAVDRFGIVTPEPGAVADEGAA